MTKISKTIILLAFFISAIASADTVTTTTTTVKNVPNNPNVMSDSDQRIVTNVYDKFAKSSALIGTNLNVMSDSGVITINGRVTNQSQADEALNLAKTTPGAKVVRSAITVVTSPPTYVPPAQTNY